MHRWKLLFSLFSAFPQTRELSFPQGTWGHSCSCSCPRDMLAVQPPRDVQSHPQDAVKKAQGSSGTYRLSRGPWLRLAIPVEMKA